MNMMGEKVRVRTRRSSDYFREAAWAQDPRVTELDPSVGSTFNDWRFAIETLDGKHIGSCSLYNHDGKLIQLGIRIGDKNYWGKGYGTEAVNILTNYCFSMMSVESIWLKVLPSNARAIKCYEKCGFVKTGQLALGGYDFLTMERSKGQ